MQTPANAVALHPTQVPRRKSVLDDKTRALPEPARSRWYAVLTEGQKEIEANYHLRRVGFWTFFPQRLTLVKHARAVESVARPYLPRYVFVQVRPGQAFGHINDLPGVSTVVWGADGPLAIDDIQMARLQVLADPDGLIVPPMTDQGPKVTFEAGTKVRIVDGPFAAFDGIVEGMDEHGAVRIETLIFGRPTPVTVPTKWVEKERELIRLDDVPATV